MLLASGSTGLKEAEASKDQVPLAPVNQMRTASFDSALLVQTPKFIVRPVEREWLAQYTAQTEEEIVIEVQMPRGVVGSLNTGIIFVFEASADGVWKAQPVKEIDIGNAIRYSPPPEARTLGFVAGEATAAIELKPGFAGRICLQLDTSSRSGFLWSLGYRRSTTITGIRPTLTDQATCSAHFASENRSSAAAPQADARLDRAAWSIW